MKGKSKKILNNYTFKEMDSAFKGIKDLEIFYKLQRKFGFNDSGLNKTFEELEEEAEKYKRLKEIIYKFNKYFSERGWIAFESLDKNLIESCVDLADKGKLEEAEEELINYYFDREKIDVLIKRLIYYKDFQPRRSLFQLALEDHFNERFHSSAPIFLMMIDGFVSDIEQYGFFTAKVDVTIWDTIVGHDINLGEIQRMLNKGRRKTIEDEIDLPYRNGILHGRDLGYANSKVSAKSLGILISLRDWADAIKEGKREQEKEYTTPTIKESFEKLSKSIENYQETKKQKEYISNDWEPRQIIIGIDLPANGDVENYTVDTPEQTLVEFLNYLIKKNYGKQAAYIAKLFNKEESIGKIAGEISKVFKEKELHSFEIVKINDAGAALTNIETLLEFKTVDNKIIKDKRNFRLIYQNGQGDTLLRGYHDGEWKIIFNFYDIEYLM